MQTFRARITIVLRKAILDVQGKTVEQSLHGIGFSTISDVHIGKYVELNVQAEDEKQAYSLVEDASQKLIANPIMEDYHIDITPIAAEVTPEVA